MGKLEEYLDKCAKINYNILTKYKEFDYNDYDDFIEDFLFLVNHIYKIKITDDVNIRINQEKFRRELIKKYGEKCMITNNTCIDQIEACHIKEYKDDNFDNTVNNGLLLTSNIHNTFDRNKWTINPVTFKVELQPKSFANEVDKKNYYGDIINYENIIVNLFINQELKDNLQFRYDKFKN